jgi:hypothetical protein
MLNQDSQARRMTIKKGVTVDGENGSEFLISNIEHKFGSTQDVKGGL